MQPEYLLTSFASMQYRVSVYICAYTLLFSATENSMCILSSLTWL